MNSEPSSLSKSRFIAGLQCLKRLWFQCYRYDEWPEPDPATQALFDTGHEVGKLAQQLVPGGTLVEEDHLHHDDAVRTTQRLMAGTAVPAIYEAAFTFEGIRIRVDILERSPGDRWRMLEVKASTSVKDYHHYDVAIQQYVLEGCGLNVAAACLVHLNNQYVYDGEQLVVGDLFIIEDLSESVASLKTDVLDLLSRERTVLAEPKPPPIQADTHCHDPYTCEWYDECRAAMPEFWVNDLYYVGAARLAQLKELGVREIGQIPDSVNLTLIQTRIRDCVRSGEMFVDPALKNAFADLVYPVHYLDFETFAPAIPRYKDTRPYETIPFQWSDHVLHEDNTLEHHEWLCDSDRDPRQEFARSLIDALGESGSIITYSSYERTRLNKLIEALPHLTADLQAIVDRLWDLLPVVRHHICHPQLYSSFSLKCVLPALLPDMSYDGLVIQDGTAASVAYAEMIDAATRPERKAEIRGQLLDYCSLDTMAMVKLHQRCLELAREHAVSHSSPKVAKGRGHVQM